jgi:hypothetical protein
MAYTEEQRKQQTEAEYERLVQELNAQISSQILPDKSKVKMLHSLFAEVAFLSVTLSECKSIIQKEGIFEEYRNSATQYGRKKSAAIETYERYAALYLKTLQAVDKATPEGMTFSLPAYL